jgi:hypothetical protein
MKKNLLPFLFLLYSMPGFSQTPLVLDPHTRYQTMEGWGVSLAWWANIAGGWSDAKIDTLCTWLTSPTGLNMNIFRFNIAGQENPSHNHFRYSATLQGYKVSEFAAYDFTRDETQRKILLKLKSKRSDCIFEAVAYSPPYWMTNSGCTAGNTGGTDNLKSGYYDDFADYLTEVVKYYHDNFNVTFRTLAPINEPSSTWWLVNGPQGGCHYSSANQVAIFNEVYTKLQSKTMLGYCTLSAVDASNPQETITELNVFVAQNIMSKISQVNTHAYTQISVVNQYRQLYDSVKKYEKKLWQSESGPLGLGSVPSDGFANNLYMTDALIKDMRNLHPVAWCDWQYGDLGNTWSHVQYDSNATFAKVPNFYNRMQVSRFIRPGHTIISSSETNSLAAINSSNDTVALVINNSSLTDKAYSIDLNLFSATGSSAQVYRITTGMDGAHWYGSAYKVYTYQTVTGLANGTYTAKAWVKSSGGQTQCYLEAKNYGGSAVTVNIPRSVSWTQVTIPNITVSNGQCVVGVYSNGAKNTWCEFDDIQLYLNSAPTVNYVSNHNFENTNTFSQTISGWSTSDTAAADFVQSLSHANNEECALLSAVSITNGILSFTAKKKSISTLLIPVTQAAAKPVNNGNYRLIAKHSNKHMSVAGWSTTDGAIIEQWDSLNQSNQVFNIQWSPSGYKILPSYSASVVTVDGYSTSSGGVINQWSDLEQTNQRFSLIDVGGGYYKIVSRSSGKCLAVNNNGIANGDDIVQWEWLNYDNFKWKLQPVALSAPLANGAYTIRAKHSNKVMSVAGSSSANGATLEQWANVCQDNEKFNLRFTSAGYTIKPVYNTKHLTVSNQSVANGAAIVQWDSLGQSNQFYEIADLGSGYYKIVSRYTNKTLAVAGSGMADGDDIIQWQWLNNDNFKWAFETPCNPFVGGKVAGGTAAALVKDNRPSVSIYPNPSSGIVNIQYDGIDNARMELLNVEGKLIVFRTGLKNNFSINEDGKIGKGIYMLKIIGTKQHIVTKVVIQ